MEFERKMKMMMKEKGLFTLSLLLFTSAATAAELPAGYTQIEYIESIVNSSPYISPGEKFGGQYIDTGYICKSTTKIVCEVSMTESQRSDTGWAAAFGACNGSFKENAFVFFLKDSDDHVRYNRTGEEASGDGFVFPRNVRTTITCTGKSATWSNVLGDSASITLGGDAKMDDGTCPLLIFDKNASGNGGVQRDYSAAFMKLYSFRIYEGAELKRDFVPCTAKATGESGLWDRVGGMFYKNEGDRGFAAGGAVETVEYYDPNDEATKSAAAAEVTGRTDTLEDGMWYVVKGNVERGMITVNGSANLILADGAKLMVDGDNLHCSGIDVVNDNAITIWGQARSDGELVAIGGTCSAGIGGGSKFDLQHDFPYDYVKGGTVTINGGIVTATGDSFSAGIGGDWWGFACTVTINGGTVTATGGEALERGSYPQPYGIGRGADINTNIQPTLCEKVEVVDGSIDGVYVKIDWKKYCVGGDIAKGANDIWVVTPNAGATEVTIRGLPEADIVAVPPTITQVNGVDDKQIRVYDGKNDVTDEYFIYNGFIATFLKATFTLGEHIASVTYTTEPAVASGTATGDFTIPSIPQGVVVKFEVVCDDGYEYYGETTWTVGDDGLSAALADVRPARTVAFTLGRGIASVTYTTDPDMAKGRAKGNFELELPIGTVVTLDILCDKGYEYLGDKTLTVGSEDMNVAITAETEYTQVEYIESTKYDEALGFGGQYIDTEYTAGANTRVVMDAYLPPKEEQNDDSVVLFGTRTTGTWSEKAFSIQLLGLKCIRFAYNGEYVDSPVVSFGERRTITCDNKHVAWTGSDAGSEAVTVSPLERSKSTLYIFGDNTVVEDGDKRDGAFNRSVMRLYSFKIYDTVDGVANRLVRNFVPCVAKTTGEVGLWDCVERKFYGNAGTGAFLRPLPTGYRAVEYIESSKGGRQYIDTEYTAGANTKVVMDAYLPPVEKQYDDSVVLFGTRTTGTWSEKAFSIQLLGLKCIRFAYNGEYVDSPVVSFGERRTITCDNKRVAWTGSDAGSEAVTVSPLERSKSTLYIFGDNTVVEDGDKRDGAFNSSVMRLYSFRICEGDVLKRNFVPCVVTATGKAGLYDMVEGKFYPNKGNDSFRYPECIVDVTKANFENCRTLYGGYPYRFAEDVDFTANAGESAMKVADGENVTLEIPAGVTVVLRGGDASGASGAGAGIEVPASATLNIAGGGELIAIGGNAANGGRGVDGACDTVTEDDEEGCLTSGVGGTGGDGGGGAGAGIGGKGGDGGKGGAGGEGVSITGRVNKNGNAGGNGGDGSAGGTCGTVNIRGAVTVSASGGVAATAGGGGGSFDAVLHVVDWASDICGYVGGGGGGGGSGDAAADIGGGGAGGGGGGGGGSGGTTYDTSIEDNISYALNGEGGIGGAGAKDGGNGEDMNDNSIQEVEGVTYILHDDGEVTEKYFKNKYHYNGGIYIGTETCDEEDDDTDEDLRYADGGAGGKAGANGGDGTLNVDSTAKCHYGNGGAYDVGKISDTEYIRWENDKLWRVENGVYTEIAYETVNGGTGNFEGGKWYVVKDVVNRIASINVGEGKPANLVLLYCAKLTVDCSSKNKQTGIWVPSGRSLNIFGVVSGTLTATGGVNAPGIGGGENQSAGALTVYGGTVKTTGGKFAAGIGGGYGGAGGTVTINGGRVTAQGGKDAAGIGGGWYGAGGEVMINGGKVTVFGGGNERPIGAGYNGSSQGSLKLGPRVFKIDDNHYLEGIAASFSLPSYLRFVSAVDENGVTLRTSSQDGIVSVYGPGAIPRTTMTFDLTETGYRWTESNTVTVGPFDENVTLSSDALPQVRAVALSLDVPDSLRLISAVAENGTKVKTEVRDGITYVSSFPDCRVILTFGLSIVGYSFVDNGVVVVEPINENTTFPVSDYPKVEKNLVAGSVEYLLADGSVASASEVSWVYQADSPQALPSGWYIVGDEVTTSTLNVQGAVNLILADGATLTVNGGIRVAEGNTLNVFCQHGATGMLIAKGSGDSAGIGGGANGVGGTVTINGGTVTATGGEYGAGIGGGNYGAGGTVTINGGMVTARGGRLAAGIGGGRGGNGGVVTINGGVVNATGGEYGAGIGGGYHGAGGTLTVHGGTVTANGGNEAVGIGGGLDGVSGTVTIDGGSVKASSIQGQPKNAAGDNVYCVTVDGIVTSGEITGLSDYGLKDVVPINGLFYFYLPNNEYSFMVDGLSVKATVNDGPTKAQVTYDGAVTIFDDGFHYLESSNGGGQYIDTGYIHKANTRIECSVNVASEQGQGHDYPSVFGSFNSSYKSKAFIFYAKFRGANTPALGRTGTEQAGEPNSFPYDTRVDLVCEGRQASWCKFGEALACGSISNDTATVDDGGCTTSIFAINNNGSQQGNSYCTMRLHSFKIYEGEELKRDFVPARAVEHPAVVGLYDRVTKQFYLGHGSGSFALGYEGPICVGGSVAEESGVWVITPNTGAKAVSFKNLPEEAKLAVKLNGCNVPSEAFMGWGVGVFSLALNPEGEVNGVKVQPTIGELDAGEPFVVGEGSAAVTVKAIPGLKYELVRGDTVEAVSARLESAPYQTVAVETATGATVTLTDDEPPAGQAFYRIVVSVP